MKGALVAVTLVLLSLACARFQEGPVEIPEPDLRFVEIDGWRIRVETHGDQGSPVVLIHGYGASLSEWRPILPRLCAAHRCVLLDLPGFGWSDKYAGRYRPADLAAVVGRVMDALGVPTAHVVAHSWGSSVALALALDEPRRVRSLCLTGAWVFHDQLNTFFRWARVRGIGEALFTLFYDEQPELRLRMGFAHPEAHVTDEKVARVARILDLPGFKRAALQAARDQNLEDLEGRYPEVDREVLLLWGDQDRVSLPFYGWRLHGVLPGSRMVLLPDAGHSPQIEVPELWAREVVDFLARLDRGEVME